MAQEAGFQGEGGQGNSPDRRDKRRGVLPFVALAILILIVLLLLWMFLQRPQSTPTASVSETDAIAVVIPPAPANPSVPAPSTLPSDASTVSIVPNVIGDPESNARRALEAAGFSVSVTKRFDANKAPGIVFSQTPGAGTSLDPGSVVSIVVAGGSTSAGTVTMPDVIGLSQADAQSRVKSAGLTPYVTYGNAPTRAGTVISQWPLGGKSATAGSQGMIQIGINP